MKGLLRNLIATFYIEFKSKKENKMENPSVPFIPCEPKLPF